MYILEIKCAAANMIESRRGLTILVGQEAVLCISYPHILLIFINQPSSQGILYSLKNKAFQIRRTTILKICKLCAAQLMCVTKVDLHMSTAAAYTRGRHVD